MDLNRTMIQRRGEVREMERELEAMEDSLDEVDNENKKRRIEGRMDILKKRIRTLTESESFSME